MEDSEYFELILQSITLQKVAKDYPGKTIENVIVQIESRIKECKQIIICRGELYSPSAPFRLVYICC